MNLDIDKKGGQPVTHQNSRDILSTYIDEACMSDIWRHQHPSLRLYTWKRMKPTPIFCRLDMFFVSDDLIGNVQKSDILPGFRSDHSMITLDIDFNAQERGKGFWKLNTSLLSDKDYVDCMNVVLDNSIEKYQNEQPSMKLELIKTEIAGASIKYSFQKAKSRKNIIDALDKKIKRLEQNLSTELDHSKRAKIHKDLDNTKLEYNSKLYDKTKAAMFRCRAKWHEEGEKTSKYFFNLEKSRFNKRVMKSTYLPDGTLTSDPNKILKELSDFFRRLFSSDTEVVFDIENDNDIKLTDREKARVDRPFTIADFASALKSMPNNKTPGCDGIPADFYKVFWGKMKNILYEAIMYDYEQGELHISARRGIITLIPKKNKDQNYIKNWRPLTMLNVDYKIVAKALAVRLKQHLKKLIHPDQTGFLQGRFIGENIRKILDLIEYTEQENIPALLISVDFEKCFDRIEWQAVKGALKFFNFGDNFIKWIDLLYTNVQSCTLNNGNSSSWFNIERGLRQGCPLSPYLFLVGAEIFAILMRKNTQIKGIQLNNYEYKLTQYADDTNIFTLFETNSLKSIIDMFAILQKQTGLKVNYEKTNIYRIGSLRHSSAKLYTQKTFKWVTNPITVLGTYISNDPAEVLELNYNAILNKIVKITELWGNRELSLIGKLLL